MNREVLAEVERQLSLSDSGRPLAMSTAGRYRKVAHACIRRAVELDQIEADPWPPAPRGRNRRKARRKRTAVDVRVLPSPETMVAVIDAIPSHQPGSRIYQVMTAVSYYAGLRPSEVVMLRPRALNLSATGWGSIEVVEADIDYDEPGEPKTDYRTVPIPPRLVELLRSWIDEHELGPALCCSGPGTIGGRRRRTGRGRCIGPTGRSGHPPMRVYDLRHAAATTWLRAGVPLGEVARRLGHSVETLVSTYVGALQGDDIAANKLIDAAYSTTRERIVLEVPEFFPCSSRGEEQNRGKRAHSRSIAGKAVTRADGLVRAQIQ